MHCRLCMNCYGTGYWVCGRVFALPTTHPLANCVTIYAKTTVHFSLDSSMLTPISTELLPSNLVSSSCVLTFCHIYLLYRKLWPHSRDYPCQPPRICLDQEGIQLMALLGWISRLLDRTWIVFFFKFTLNLNLLLLLQWKVRILSYLGWTISITNPFCY
jgi:hypothetical protein